jgi:uncharacterized protein (UPF0548 family)
MDDAALAAAKVTYDAIGATRDPALAPAGFRRLERRARIGSGEERWRHATREVLGWGVKRRSGFRVRQIAARDDGRVHQGDTAMLGFGPLREPVRVVYVVDEPDRQGFGYGTLEGHPLRGEESFVVERRDDGAVWIVVRSFSRPSTRLWTLLGPLVRVAQAILTRRYLSALAGRIRAS